MIGEPDPEKKVGVAVSDDGAASEETASVKPMVAEAKTSEPRQGVVEEEENPFLKSP